MPNRETDPNPKRGIRGQRLVCIFLLGVVLFNFPILAIFNVGSTLFGVPLLFAYLFLAWAALILLISSNSTASALSLAIWQVPAFS